MRNEIVAKDQLIDEIGGVTFYLIGSGLNVETLLQIAESLEPGGWRWSPGWVLPISRP